MFAYIEQYLFYLLAIVIVVLGIALGVQTFRLSETKKDLIMSQQETAIEKGKVATMAATMRQLATVGDELQDKYNQAQQSAQDVIRKHKATAESLAKAPVPAACSDALRWARDTAKGIEEGW